MSLFGKDGIIEFRRELPSPVVIPAAAVDKTNKVISLFSDEFWPGEPVVLVGSVGGVQSTITGFFGKDTLDKAALYSTIAGACSSDPASRISLSSLQAKPVVLLVNNHPCQTLEILKFYNNIVLANNLVISDEVSLGDWPEREDAYYAAGPRFAEWKIVASMRGWNLNTSAPAVDVSSIGSKFSEAVKSAVTGSGSLDFIIDLFGSATEYSPDAILRVVLLTERGALGNARFYVAKEGSDEDADPCKGKRSNRSPIKTSVYYNANILFTNSVVDMSADALAQGSADFVTTGPIRLAAETEKPVTYSCDGGSGTYDFWSYTGSRGQDKRGAGHSTYYNGNGELFTAYSYDSNIQFTRQAVMVEKFNQFGILAWQRSYTGSVTDDFYIHPWPGPFLIEDDEGYPWLIFTRALAGTTATVKTYIARLDPGSGTVVESCCFTINAVVSNASVAQSAAPSAACMDTNKNFYIVFTYGTYASSIFIVKVSRAGSFIWSRETNGQVNVIGGNGPGNSAFNAITSMKVYGGILYVQYNYAALQKFDLDGNMLTPWTQYAIQTSMGSTNTANASSCNFRFDTNGNIYVAYGNTAIIAKYDQNLQPLWAYYFTETSIGDGLYPAGTQINSGGVDLTIDDQNRIFLSTSRTGASQSGYSSAQGFIEVSTDGALIGARTIYTNQQNNNEGLSNAAYAFASQKRGKFDPLYIPVFQTSISKCLGYLQKSGQVGSWAVQAPPSSPPPFIINQPNFTRSLNLGHTVYNQLYNKWTVYSPGHQLLADTVASSTPSGLGYAFKYRAQTGVITS